MKILLYMSSFSGGGGERTIVNLANGFFLLGNSVSLVVSQDSGPRREEVLDGVEVISLNKKRERYALFSLDRVVRQIQPDLCVSTLSIPNILLFIVAKILNKRKKIILIESNFRSHSEKKSFLFEKGMLRLSFRSADRVVAISEGLKREMIDLYKLEKDKVKIIFNPLMNEEVLVASELKDEKSERFLNNTRGRTKIVAIGRLHHQKGFDLLLKAFSLLKNTDTSLLILGEGKDLSVLKKISQDLKVEDRVIFTGYLKNPFYILRESDIFVLSSRWEGFGNVVAESMICGTPVVSFDCPSGPGEIIENSEVGVLCPPEDISSLAGSLDLMISIGPDGREKYSQRAFETINRFDYMNIARQYISLYEEI